VHHAIVWIKRITTFAIVCFAWVFFRATSVSEAFHLLSDLSISAARPELTTAALVTAVIATICILMDLRLEKTGEEYLFQSLEPQRRFATGTAFLAATLLFAGSEPNAFIYFQF